MAIAEPPVRDATVPDTGAATPHPPASPAAGAPIRVAVAALLPAIGAAVIAGGIFTGPAPRIYAIAAVLAGSLLALFAQRLTSPWLSNLVALAGLFAVGVAVAMAVDGPGAAGRLGSLLSHAVAQSRLVRPPISLTGGFAALLAWIMAALGFGGVWLATVIRRPAIGLLLPLGLAAVAAISVPQGEQVIDGIVVVTLFGIGLAVLSGDRSLGDDQALPLAYELRRGLKALPVMVVLVGGLYLLAQADFLFPHPVIDPTLQAQPPKVAPLSSVKDRVLFEVRSQVTGPWVLGTLDTYDGKQWLLPPFAQRQLRDVPASGVVDRSLEGAISASFTMRDLGGAVLPGLPNVVGVQARGPKLAYDAHSGNIRLVEGEIPPGFTYRVAAAGVPDVSDLRNATSFPSSLSAYTRIPDAPPSVRNLIAQAPTTSKWDQFDFLRLWVLHNITVAGLGTPVPISPERMDQILTQTKEASPFELVAMQVMLARWVGVPARIGYGFDGGVKVNDRLEVHPSNGTAFPEVFFPRHGWLPVIGTPSKAQASAASDPRFQQFQTGVEVSNDIAVPLFLPAVVPTPASPVDEVRTWVLVALAIVAFVALVYFLLPGVVKVMVRLRHAAEARDPRSRLVLAYAQWRDTLSDYGYRHPGDTPIMLLRHFPEDDEHTELAWLVTRALWGDLRGQATEEVAADAEELSRSLRRRLAQAQPITVRVVAALSRESLRRPYNLPPERAAAEAEVRRAA